MATSRRRTIGFINPKALIISSCVLGASAVVGTAALMFWPRASSEIVDRQPSLLHGAATMTFDDLNNNIAACSPAKINVKLDLRGDTPEDSSSIQKDIDGQQFQQAFSTGATNPLVELAQQLKPKCYPAVLNGAKNPEAPHSSLPLSLEGSFSATAQPKADGCNITGLTVYPAVNFLAGNKINQISIPPLPLPDVTVRGHGDNVVISFLGQQTQVSRISVKYLLPERVAKTCRL